MTRNRKDRILRILVYAASALTFFLLLTIIGFIFIKGLSRINIDFLTRNFDNKTTYVNVNLNQVKKENRDKNYIKSLGAVLKTDKESGITFQHIDRDSPLKKAKDTAGAVYKVRAGDKLVKAGNFDIKKEWEKSGDEQLILKKIIAELSEQQTSRVKLKIMRPGGGIVPMLVTTIYMIALTLLLACPVGILATVYLNEYAGKGKVLSLIQFAIKNLAGIPSIIYGLFGSLFFVQVCKMQYSLLAGAMTVSIILLPIIISTTREALKTVPDSYRESSMGLGATKLQTVLKVVLPNAVPGILSAVILSIGRIAGESAALLLTAGTAAQIPKALYGSSSSGATLTIKMYTLMKEENDLKTACAIGIVLIIFIVILNFVSNMIANSIRRNYGKNG